MDLLLSVLFLLLYIAIIALAFYLIVWALRYLGIVIDPMVMKAIYLIFGLIVIIVIVSWLAGALPTRYPFRLGALARGLPFG